MVDVERTEGVPGTKIFEVIYGSWAHGTNTPTSDIDVRGVFLLPDNDFLGIGRPKTTWENKPEDRVFWELGHFVNLLIKGNPNIVGMLFVEGDCVLKNSGAISGLPQMRRAFLSQSLRSAYMGWIHRESADIAKLHKGHAKRLSHIPRLAWELMSVYETGMLVVRPPIAKRDVIKLIKTGDMDYDEAMGYVGALILDLEKLDDEIGPSLPPAPHEEANEWLLETRKYYGGR